MTLPKTNLGGWYSWSIIGLLVLASFFFGPGYQAFVNDQHLYLPIVWHSLHPELFVQDFLLSFNQSRFTLFDELLASLVRMRLSLDVVLLALSIISRITLFSAVYYLFLKISKSRWLALVGLVFILPAQYVYGTQMITWDVYLTPRLLAFGVSLWVLLYYQEKRYVWTGILFLITVALHVITAILPAAVISLYWLKKYISNSSRKLFLLVLFVLLISGLVLIFLPRFDSTWYEIIRQRDPYIFFSSWPRSSYFYLLVDSLLLLLFYQRLKSLWSQTERNFYGILLMTPLVLFLLALLFSDGFHLALIGQLQLMRALIFWRYLLPVFSLTFFVTLLPAKLSLRDRGLWLIFFISFFTLEPLRLITAIALLLRYVILPRLLSESVTQMIALGIAIIGLLLFGWSKWSIGLPWEVISIVLALVIVSFVLLLTANKKKEIFMLVGLGLILYWLKWQAWQAPIFQWQQSSLAHFSLCSEIMTMVPPSETIFVWPANADGGVLRLGCLRSVYASRSDGAQVVFDHDFALAWQQRTEESSQWRPTAAGYDWLQNKGIHYILTASPLPFGIITADKDFKLYNLTQPL